MSRPRIILAIESSCDETAMAIIKGQKEILASVVSSQIKDHASFGGVIPELASRLHYQNIDIVFDQVMKEANLTIKDIDGIAIVNGPGLIGALHVGVVFAKSLASINNIPILPVNHIAGHVYANNLIADLQFPLLALIVSGGHTELVYMEKHLDFKILGQTQDDAIGESYDKVARILNLGYPGGPIIDQLAQKGKDIYDFPMPLNDDSYNFSYSGLKSAVINKVNTLKMKNEPFNNEDISASFQKSAVDILIKKSLHAAKTYPIKQFILGGGVAANSYLRSEIERVFKKQLPNVEVVLPPLWATTDNAAMIASLASFYDENEFKDDYGFGVNPNMSLDAN